MSDTPKETAGPIKITDRVFYSDVEAAEQLEREAKQWARLMQAIRKPRP